MKKRLFIGLLITAVIMVGTGCDRENAQSDYKIGDQRAYLESKGTGNPIQQQSASILNDVSQSSDGNVVTLERKQDRVGYFSVTTWKRQDLTERGVLQTQPQAVEFQDSTVDR